MSFSRHYGIDYVHDIWLRYFEKTGKNLFKEKKSNRWIYKAVRNEFLNSIRNNHRYSELFDTTGEELYFKSTPIVDNIMYNELDHFIKNKIIEFSKQRSTSSNASSDFDSFLKNILNIYELIKLGYTSDTEISKQLNLKKYVVAYYKKLIKEAIEYMPLNNPFNGNKTTIKRMILDSTFEEKSDKEDYFLDDENEYYKLFVHKESGDGLLVKVTNPNGSEHYLKTNK